MEKKTGTSRAETAYGKKLDTAIPYEFEWEVYTSDEEFAADTKAHLSMKEQRKVRENEAQANARQKALQKALDDAKIVRPTIENDPQLRLRDMYKVLMSSGRFEKEQAVQLASTTLGIEWEQATLNKLD